MKDSGKFKKLDQLRSQKPQAGNPLEHRKRWSWLHGTNYEAHYASLDGRQSFRQANESLRQANKSFRQADESFRQLNEKLDQTNESLRQANEHWAKPWAKPKKLESTIPGSYPEPESPMSIEEMIKLAVQRRQEAHTHLETVLNLKQEVLSEKEKYWASKRMAREHKTVAEKNQAEAAKFSSGQTDTKLHMRKRTTSDSDSKSRMDIGQSTARKPLPSEASFSESHNDPEHDWGTAKDGWNKTWDRYDEVTNLLDKVLEQCDKAASRWQGERTNRN